MVRLVGFEPTTYGLEVRCSIQLSYRRIEKFLDQNYFGWHLKAENLFLPE